MLIVDLGFAFCAITGTYSTTDYYCATRARRAVHRLAIGRTRLVYACMAVPLWFVLMGEREPVARQLIRFLGGEYTGWATKAAAATAVASLAANLGICGVFLRQMFLPASIASLKPASRSMIAASIVLGLSLTYLWLPTQ